LDSTHYVSDAANELIFFSDSTTFFPTTGARNITTNVPATLEMNTLTLNGRGSSSGAVAIAVTIGSSASTWTIGNRTTSIVNLNSNQGAATAAGFNYNVAAASITGPVGGADNVAISTSNPATAGTLTLNGTSTGGWSGTTTSNAGMTLALNARDRSFFSTSARSHRKIS
jgi:hypothetical protein